MDSNSSPAILYVVNSFDGGGAETGLVTMVRGGMFSGCRLTVASLVRGSGGIETQLSEAGQEPVILVNRSRMRASDLLTIFRGLRALIRRVRPAVIIASLPQANLLARLATLFRKDILFISFEHNSHLAKRAYEIAYRLTSPRVDWVFADSSATLEVALRRLYRKCPPRKSIVPLVAFSARAPSERGSRTDTFHVINAARFTAVKNQSALIEAMAMVSGDATLTLYGNGPMREECMALATRLGICDRVSFPGFVPDWAQRPADLFVLASRHEGLCIVVLEAMRAGIPVAAQLIGGLRDYADAESIRVLEAADADAIAAAISEATENRALDYAKASRAERMVENRFGIDAVRALYREVNRSLIEAARSRHGVQQDSGIASA